MNTIQAGGLAGALATVPMTMAMTALHRTLPKHERYPLPPKLITRSLVGKAQARVELNEAGLNALTLLAHVGRPRMAHPSRPAVPRLSPT